MSARRVRLARFGLLATAFTVSACGLVYELALITLGAYLVGNTAKQASIVLAVMVFAMGLGALAAKPLRRWPALAFAAVELTLALLGGFSVICCTRRSRGPPCTACRWWSWPRRSGS